MTSRAVGPKWKVCLAFVLVCQTARGVDGHPRRSSGPDPQNPITPRVTDVIRAAYENGELLSSRQWLRRNDQDDGTRVARPVQRDTSRQLETVMNYDASVSLTQDAGLQGQRRGMWKVPSMSPMATSLRPMHSDDNIIFPTENNRFSAPGPAAACENSTYCENVANYPKQLVNAAIARNASIRFLESVDPLSDIEQRIDATDESPLCRYREQVIYPQTAKNKEHQWLFVVNQDNLRQGIRIEVCVNDGQECSMIEDFAEGYKTTCKQKYIYRELAAVATNGDVIKDSFRFPSSCCCHVKFTGDPQLRFGLLYNQTMATSSKSQRRM